MPAAPRLRPCAGWAFVFALAALATDATAQTTTGVIAGTIVDRSTRAPLSDVRVFVPGTTLGTATNARGEYRLSSVRCAPYSRTTPCSRI